MANKLVYVLVFLLAFIGTTGVIYFLNTRYENIFAFDFSAPKVYLPKPKPAAPGAAAAAAGSAAASEGIAQTPGDSTSAAPEENNTENTAKEDSVRRALLDEIAKLKKDKQQLMAAQKQIEQKDKQIARLQTTVQVKQDSAYIKWKREMVKIYEAMDSGAAAKIIQKLPDNVAKDIIFLMKKKKAAQIISQLNPESANRLTRMH